MTMLGFNMESNLYPTIEPFYHINANKEWTNVNVWGSFMIPFDASTNNFFRGLQHFDTEQNLNWSLDQTSRARVASTQSSNKGKEIVNDASGKRGKKVVVTGKGKAKATKPTLNMTTVSTWMKRGGPVGEG